MFNKNLREDAIQNLKSEQERYELQNKRLVEDAEELFGIRVQFKRVIDDAWEFLNSLRNKPTQLDTELEEIKIQTNKFSGLIEGVEQEIEKQISYWWNCSYRCGRRNWCSFGPTAAMQCDHIWYCINRYSYSFFKWTAATISALAWLVAVRCRWWWNCCGHAVLGLAGPIGWAIGGGALATAGLIKSGKIKRCGKGK